ncbi:ferredoxin reductase [Mariniluteicoccus flavus]
MSASTASTSSLLGGVRRLAEALASPRTPGDYLDLFDPLRSGADMRGRIVAIRRESGSAVTVELKPGRDWRGHVPGQYVRIGVEVDGVRQWRAYSITGAAGSPTLTITAKPILGGAVSNHLATTAKAGDLVMLEQAAGEFVLPETMPARLLFLTAGSGITPVIGMLRGHADELSDVVVVHSAPSADEVVFGPELRALAADDRVRLIERHTELEGRLAADQLDALVPDWRERETWACGPAAMLDDFESHWAEAGLADALHIERFRPTVLAEPGEGGDVAFAKSGVDVDAPGDRPLLDVGEDAGVLMPSGCRMGICFGCVAPLRTGTVRDLRTGETHSATDDPVMIQTCVSAAAGTCVIDL